MLKLNDIWNTKNLIAYVLFPISYIYGVLSKISFTFIRPKKVSIPVISVGNLSVGGTGKTPITRYIVKFFQRNGLKTATILRGYKGRITHTTKVDPSIHKADDVGDEAILHSYDGDTWVSTNRYLGAQEAIKYGAEIIILDDAHQNFSLKKDISLIVVDGTEMFGNEYLLPAGPLRENIKSGLNRADGIIICNESIDLHREIEKSNKPIFYNKFIPEINLKELKDCEAYAFCGIANPRRFYKTLEDYGVKVVKKKTFGDHHKYKDNEINDILRNSTRLGLVTITTEKDITKIKKKYRDKISTLKIKVEWRNNQFIDFLIKKISIR